MEIDNGNTSDGTEFRAADITAWLRYSKTLDYCNFESPEMQKKVVLSLNEGKQEMEEYLQS